MIHAQLPRRLDRSGHMLGALLRWSCPLLVLVPDVCFAQPPPLLDPAPDPLSAPPERARRWFELGPELGVAIPQCESDSGTGCAALTAGTELGLVGLVRPTPNFAFGVEARRFVFDLDVADHRATTRASAWFAGLTGRLFVLESELLDPYLELTLGAGSLALTTEADGGSSRERASFSLAARSSAGLDILPNGWLRVGAFFAVLRYFPGSLQRCDTTACTGVPARSAWSPLGATSLGVRVGVAAGELL